MAEGYTIEIRRLPPENNQPHRWHWQLVSKTTGTVLLTGKEKSKKEAIQKIQAALESVQSE